MLPLSAQSKMKLNIFQIAVLAYYCAAVSLAIFLPFESNVTVCWRIATVIVSLISIPYRDAIASAIFGSSFGSDWLVFIPLTLFYIIVFGTLYRAEQSGLLFG